MYHWFLRGWDGARPPRCPETPVVDVGDREDYKGYKAMARTSSIALRASACLVLLGLLSSCAKVVVQHPFDIASNTQSALDYQLGPEDVLEVLVWKNADLSKVVTVRPDGQISLPLIGEVQAAGFTAAQVQQEITKRLMNFYEEPPHVSLIVQQANSYVIFIVGQVERPGQYTVKRGTTFLQAIALAGGFTPFASYNEALVLRNGSADHQQSAARISYKEILGGKYQENNILLKSGDTIVIP
jgi:polysaccharide biosynthesis/export protein